MKAYFLFEYHKKHGWDYLGELYREVQGDELKKCGMDRSSWIEEEARENCTYYCVMVDRKISSPVGKEKTT